MEKTDWKLFRAVSVSVVILLKTWLPVTSRGASRDLQTSVSLRICRAGAILGVRPSAGRAHWNRSWIAAGIFAYAEASWSLEVARVQGKRRRGRQKKRWTDNIEECTGKTVACSQPPKMEPARAAFICAATLRPYDPGGLRDSNCSVTPYSHPIVRTQSRVF